MRLTLCITCISLLLVACGPDSRQTGADREEAEAQARQMIVAGNHLAAADEYLRLAKLYPGHDDYFILRAADSLIRGGKVPEAEESLKQLSSLSAQDVIYRNILRAELSLLAEQPQEAVALLESADASDLTVELSARLYNTRARAYEASGNFLGAAEQRIALDRQTIDPIEKRTNIFSIWKDLRRIKTPVLRELQRSSPENLAAWVELVLIEQTMLFKPDALENVLSSWMEQYRGHPAIPVITEDLLRRSRSAVLQPQHIALLLPLNGQYEKAAHAIRDGFLTAWYRDQAKKPRVSIYDTNSLTIDGVYQQAAADGADFIVGPLEKQAVETLLATGSIRVPTLALNHADKVAADRQSLLRERPPRFIQFGLSPEDEARQAAEKAIFDGHNRALVVTPNNSWGQRLAEAFAKNWYSLGGTVLEYVAFDQNTSDYSSPVRELLNLDSSQQRATRLRQKLNRALKSEPRLRQDADMIFMAAVPVSARQIVPQLRFYLAGNIPVYASSHAFSGIANPQADSDMNGIMFLDIPAILQAGNLNSALAADLNRNWSAENSNYRRLYALGVDAYRLIPHIGRLSLQESSVYPGETGELSMDEMGRITRKLVWARFVNGLPQTMAY